MHAADWMPTLTKLAGCKPTADLNLDGIDVWPLLTGAMTKPVPRTIYVPYTKAAAVRHGDWKVIASKDGKKRELFNLAKDPYEKDDLSQQRAEEGEGAGTTARRTREERCHDTAG